MVSIRFWRKKRGSYVKVTIYLHTLMNFKLNFSFQMCKAPHMCHIFLYMHVVMYSWSMVSYFYHLYVLHYFFRPDSGLRTYFAFTIVFSLMMTQYSRCGGCSFSFIIGVLVFQCFSNYFNVFALMAQNMTQGLAAVKIISLALWFSHSKPLIENTQDFSKIKIPRSCNVSIKLELC